MVKQKDIFKESEGDAWSRRNSSASNVQIVDKELARILSDSSPSNVLEIGCGAGQRLCYLKSSIPECNFFGIDPSGEAVSSCKEDLKLVQGTADDLPYIDGQMDAVILGFCLYLCDVEDYFVIASEANRVLADNGLLIINDFDPPFAYQNKYSHKEGLYSTKMCFRDMFTWHPSYTLTTVIPYTQRMNEYDTVPDERVSLSVLHKKHGLNLPLNPFSK